MATPPQTPGRPPVPPRPVRREGWCLAGPPARGAGCGAAARGAAKLPGGRRPRAGGLRRGPDLGTRRRDGRPHRRPGGRGGALRGAGDPVHGGARRAAPVHAGGDAAPAAFDRPGLGHVRDLAGRRVAAAVRDRRTAGRGGGGRGRPGRGRGHPAGGEPVRPAGRAGQGSHGHRAAVRAGRVRGHRMLRRDLRGRPARELVRPIRPCRARPRGHRPVRLAGADLRRGGGKAVADVLPGPRAGPAPGRAAGGVADPRRGDPALARAAGQRGLAGLGRGR